MSQSLIPSAFAALSLFLATSMAADLRISTDFEGGSAHVESVDQSSSVIRLMPGGDPERGWPCWWYFRVDGLAKDQRLTVDLGGSDRPVRNNGKDTGKPLDPNWAMPLKAAYSTDGKTWQHTAPGRRAGARMQYELIGTGEPLWIAWGPPFTPRDTDALIAHLEKTIPSASSFELARSRGGRPVRALRVRPAAEPPSRIWLQARQHAWESGSSWVARGFAEWLASDDADARWLRENAETVLVPIMDVDNAATGNGGKEAAPQDHNRDWSETPIHPEIAATQKHLSDWGKYGRFALFLDLHNPAPGDLRPFFFVGPEELLDEAGRANRARFLAAAHRHISGPLALEQKPRVTGMGYHPLWRQMAGIWVHDHAAPNAVAACLETAWNTPHSTTDGYRTVGRQLGQAIADYLRNSPR